jgi:hypothetical protein
VGDRQLARGDDLGSELELFIQGGVGETQLAGGAELLLLVQGGLGERHLAGGGEHELLVQGGVGDVQLAGGSYLGGELELFVQGRVRNRHLAGLALLCRGNSLEVSQRVPVGLRQHISEVGGGALLLDNLAQRLQNSEKF